MPAEKHNDNQIITVVGGHGYVGASTIATNIASLMTQNARQRVALLDFDLIFGSLGLAFNVTPNQGLVEALQSERALDSTELQKLALPISDNLDLYTSNVSINTDLTLHADRLQYLFTTLQTCYSTIIVDLPAQQLSKAKPILQMVQHYLLVGSLSYAAVRNIKQMLTFLQTQAPTADYKLIHNRILPRDMRQFAPRDFKRLLHNDIIYLPHAGRLLNKALQQGMALAQYKPHCRFVSPLKKIVATLNSKAAIYPPSRWKKLWNI